MVKLIIKDASNLDVNLLSVFGSVAKYRVKIIFINNTTGTTTVRKGEWSTHTTKSKQIDAKPTSTNSLCCTWENEMIDLSIPGMSEGDNFQFVLERRYTTMGAKMETKVLGETHLTLSEIKDMFANTSNKEDAMVELFLFREDNKHDMNTGDLVYAGKGSLPSIVRVGILLDNKNENDDKNENVGDNIDGSIPQDEVVGEEELYDKRVMIMTRGTRGDIQPFLALAKGLAEEKNWEVIFVTELFYKGGVIKVANSIVKGRGKISFRPSGGDTTKKTSKALAKYVINVKLSAPQTNAMQRLFLSRSEVEFFHSEPALYYWAKKLQPSLLIYGFTMASVATVISETLKIPLIGFILQPTSIPSEEYPPCLPLLEVNYKKLTKEKILSRHKKNHAMKHMMDNLGSIVHNSDCMFEIRKRRGLEVNRRFETESVFQQLKEKNYPMVIPINETMFGGKPKDWSENTVFTDCIFMRGDMIPPLAEDAQSFINNAKADGGKVIVLCFSSMPVTKTQIIEIALRLIRQCSEKVCVFALVGGTEFHAPLDTNSNISLEEVQEATDNNRLFLASRAPFGRLFPLVDTIVLHGGLGTTSEVIQAKVPAIVTGVLLLDQRFWGMRCSKLGVGPYGLHIQDFPNSCVEYVDKALAEDSDWKANAIRVGTQLSEEAKDDPSGVKRNVDAIARLSTDAKPYWYEAKDAFEAFDLSKDKVLDVDEFRACIKVLNLPLSPEEVDELFKNADADQNGVIDLEEFKTSVFTKFFEYMDA
eukprot:CAMPEP_0194188208 /NCGR_PEP_ID=MMETSP0154-20130528/54107_1 /TAXON_ID=1049557 /ORGANISM="Thalassiothrix antarctica, Strain L6-D1" /LENGTH=759 /DNA_ID=CAMNT_0038908475 /DNA_START=32 /DNA_END=2311 /DNA_ORIENTATION=-